MIVSSQSTVADARALQQRGAVNCGLQPDALIQLPLPVEASFSGVKIEKNQLCDEAAYFMILGAWEPRKNFELLLDVWEHLLAEGGPRLVLKWVGKRGELSRRSAKRLAHLKAAGWFVECGVVSDAVILELFTNARALLFPSFAEGWGLPLAEALASGLPVIASDTMICREVSQDIAEYQVASDREAWRRCVEEYAKDDSALRMAQVNRIERYRVQVWETYFQQLNGRLA